jgi:hypothetical protein
MPETGLGGLGVALPPSTPNYKKKNLRYKKKKKTHTHTKLFFVNWSFSKKFMAPWSIPKLKAESVLALVFYA